MCGITVTRQVRRGTPILIALSLAVLLAWLSFRYVVVLHSDMVDLLPAGNTQRDRLMLDVLRSGPASSLILIGIEGAAPHELARISRSMTASLQGSGVFTLVENGQQTLDQTAEEFLFAHRYLLSPVTTPPAFASTALHQDFERLLNGLASSAMPLVERYGLADPPGAFLDIVHRWIGDTTIRLIDGVWFSRARDRALILVNSRAGGFDLGAQQTVARVIDSSFSAADPGQARLLVSGPAVFAREAAERVRRDVHLISIVSTLLVVLLLIWRFRSPIVIAAIAVPLVLSMTAAALTVQLAFGFVHNIALGFGVTMLGVTADYPVLLIGHRKLRESADGTLRRIGPTFNLAVATAVLGLAGMLFLGLPGLSQLGLFAVTGVLAGAAATRWVLPPLIVLADLAPVPVRDPARFLRIERLRTLRLWAVLPLAAAVVYLLAGNRPYFTNDLADLSPVPARAKMLDADLRAEVGAPDVGQMMIVQGPDAEAVLQKEEGVLPLLHTLRSEGAMSGAELAARYLPSAATQLARRASLPDTPTLVREVQDAEQGLPFRETAFSRFVADVAATRDLAPVTLAELTNPLIEARLHPLLLRHEDAWIGLVIPKDVARQDLVAAAFRSVPDTIYIDLHAETDAIAARYTAKVVPWLALSGAMAITILALACRDAWRVIRVVASIGAAELVTIAILLLVAQRLTLIHIVALQFVAGIGLDYALFFSRPQLDEEERARTLSTLLTCNAMTLVTFGLLLFCQTPLLQQLGMTTAIGAIAVMVFAFLFAGASPVTTSRLA
jgi:predicted exporter